MVHETMRSPLVWSIGGVGLIAGGVVALSYWNHYQPRISAQQGAMPVESVTPSNPAEPTATDPLERAKAFGWEAAVAAQTAETEADWRRVGDLWLQAIAELGQVSQNSPQQAEAQAKIQEYLANFDYAEAEKAKTKPETSSISRGAAFEGVQTALAAGPMKVQFSNDPEASKGAAITGTSADGRASVDISLADKTVSQMELRLSKTSGSKAVSMGDVVYTHQFLGTVLPEVAGQGSWITRSLKQAHDAAGNPVIEDIGNYRVTMTTDGQANQVVVSVSLARP